MPSIALEQTRGEIRRLAGLVRDMVIEMLPAFRENDVQKADKLTEMEAEIAYIGSRIDEYLIQITRRNLNQTQSEFVSQLMDVTTDLEHIGTLFKKDVGPLLTRKVEGEIPFLEQGSEELVGYHGSVVSWLEKSIEAFENNDAERAREVVRAKPDMVRQQRAYRALYYEGHAGEETKISPSSEVHLDLLDHLCRIYSYSEAIALTMLTTYLDQRKGRGGESWERPAAAA